MANARPVLLTQRIQYLVHSDRGFVPLLGEGRWLRVDSTYTSRNDEGKDIGYMTPFVDNRLLNSAPVCMFNRPKDPLSQELSSLHPGP